MGGKIETVAVARRSFPSFHTTRQKRTHRVTAHTGAIVVILLHHQYGHCLDDTVFHH